MKLRVNLGGSRYLKTHYSEMYKWAIAGISIDVEKDKGDHAFIATTATGKKIAFAYTNKEKRDEDYEKFKMIIKERKDRQERMVTNEQ